MASTPPPRKLLPPALGRTGDRSGPQDPQRLAQSRSPRAGTTLTVTPEIVRLTHPLDKTRVRDVRGTPVDKGGLGNEAFRQPRTERRLWARTLAPICFLVDPSISPAAWDSAGVQCDTKGVHPQLRHLDSG